MATPQLAWMLASETFKAVPARVQLATCRCWLPAFLPLASCPVLPAGLWVSENAPPAPVNTTTRATTLVANQCPTQAGFALFLKAFWSSLASSVKVNRAIWLR